jgi:hypothetical protein
MFTIKILAALSIISSLFFYPSDTHNSGNTDLLRTLLFDNVADSVPQSDYLQASPQESEEVKTESFLFHTTIMAHLADIRDEILKLRCDISNIPDETSKKIKGDFNSLRDDVLNWQDSIYNIAKTPVKIARVPYDVRVQCFDSKRAHVESKVIEQGSGASISLTVSPIKKPARTGSFPFSFIFRYNLLTWVWHKCTGIWR